MIRNPLKAMAIAVAAVGMIVLGGSQRAAADIFITVSSGGSTQTYDATSSNTFALTSFSGVGGYSLTIQTVITNFPGTGNQGQISTTVNVGSFTAGSGPLVTTVQLTNPGGATNLTWTGPASSPVTVSAAASFTTQVGVTAGTVTTATYYNSPPLTSGLGAATVSASAPYGSGTTPISTSASNAGTYTLSQQITLAGAVSTASAFNFGGTSSVSAVAVPEPSSMAIAGLGALGMIGYGLRRRKALGA